MFEKKKLILPLIFTIIGMGILMLMFSYTRIYKDEIYLTPFLDDDRGWDIYTLQNGKHINLSPREILEANGETVYLSRTMDVEYETVGITLLELGSKRPCTVFLDGKLLYTNSPDAGTEIGNIQFPPDFQGLVPAPESVRCTLPTGFGGKSLTIATTNTIENSGTPKVILTSESISDGVLTAVVSRWAMPAAVCATAALLMLSLLFYGGFSDHWNMSLLFLVLAAFSQCLYYLGQYENVSSGDYIFEITFSGFFQPLFIYTSMLFLISHMKKHRRLCMLFLVPLIFIGFVPSFCNLFGWNIGSWSWNLTLVVYPALVVLIIFSVLEYLDKNIVFRLFVPGFSLIVLCGIVLGIFSGFGERVILDYLLLMLKWPQVLMGWGGAALFLLCTVVSCIQVVQSTAETQTELHMMMVKNDFYAEDLRQTKASAQELAMVKHNVKNHLFAIKELNRIGDSQRLDEYLQQITGEVKAIAPLRLTLHPTVNAILCSMISRAKSAGVTFTVKVSLPETLPFPDNDLCNFLMNLLDNAILAAAALPQDSNRWVELSMNIRKSFLFIETQNSHNGKVVFDKNTNLPISASGNGHGYGMKTLHEIARHYNGELELEAIEGTFIVRTALLMPSAPQLTEV